MSERERERGGRRERTCKNGSYLITITRVSPSCCSSNSSAVALFHGRACENADRIHRRRGSRVRTGESGEKINALVGERGDRANGTRSRHRHSNTQQRRFGRTPVARRCQLPIAGRTPTDRERASRATDYSLAFRAGDRGSIQEIRREGNTDPAMKTHVAVSVIVLLIALVGTDKIDLYIPCVKTENCTNIPSLPPETICQEGYCLCPSDKGFVNCSSITHTFIHQARTPGPLVYRTCKHDQDCNFQGGLCNTTNHQCMCSKDYVPSSDNHHCVQRVQSINSSCTEDNQCLAFLANTTCRLNKCHCISGYHYVDSACLRMAEYGQSCTKSQECLHIEGAICTNNMTCECDAETVLSKDGKKCLAAARNFRDKCTESVQCKTFEHSSCIENMCQCSEGYHYEHSMTRCFLNREIDVECANNYECYQAEDYKSDPPIKSLICEANKCTCAENYVRKDNVCTNGSSLIFAAFPVIVLIVLVCVNL